MNVAPDPLVNSAVNTPGKRAVSTVKLKLFIPPTGLSFRVIRKGENVLVISLENAQKE